jgi:hypothetical protein
MRMEPEVRPGLPAMESTFNLGRRYSLNNALLLVGSGLGVAQIVSNDKVTM